MNGKSQRKKIAIINSVCGVGSTGRICVELAVFLQNNNFDTIICYGRNKIDIQGLKTYCFDSKLDFFSHAMKARVFDRSGFGSTTGTKRLINKLIEYKPDLLILNNLHGYYLDIDLFLKWLKISDIPTILILHDCWNFTGHCAYFDFVRCEKWKVGCSYKCPAKRSYPESFLFDSSKRNFNQKKALFTQLNNLNIVTPSNWLSNLVKESFLATFSCHVINNGIDTTKFLEKKSNFRKKFNLTNERIIMCIASVFDDRKGIKDILSLSKMLEENTVIVLVGLAKCSLKQYRNIIYIEKTNNIDELVNIYSSSDVMFNPTYEDTYSNTNMEALSCGIPVVCYRTGGAIEMLDQNFVVEQGDYIGAYELMKKIFDGRVSYPFNDTNDFSKEKMHKSYLGLINEILSK